VELSVLKRTSSDQLDCCFHFRRHSAGLIPLSQFLRTFLASRSFGRIELFENERDRFLGAASRFPQYKSQ